MQVGSRKSVSAHPTTWPRLLAPAAYPLLPPSVGSGRITPRSQTKPRHVWPVELGKNAEQLQLSPKGSRSEVSAMPTTVRRLWFGQDTELFGPPSVPRSNVCPCRQSTACCVRSSGKLEEPLTQPRLLMLLAPPIVPPREPRRTTEYR